MDSRDLGKGNKYLATLYRLFTKTDIKEIRDLVKSGESVEEKEEEDSDNKAEKQGTAGPRKRPSESDSDWRQRWEESMESQANENEKMIYENRELLERLDERSAWTMRLLVGLFVTIIGSAGLQVFVL